MQTPNGADYRAVATEYHDGRDYVTNLRFYLLRNGLQRQFFDFKSSDSLLYLLPSSEAASLLITVWEGGSGIRTRIFSISDTTALLIFERGTHIGPEITLAGILINTGWVPVGERCCTAEKTEIWRWTGSKYQLITTVPFDNRYGALAKLEREAKSK